ncbi:MAG: hypothetical protein ABEK03_05420 [Candidatus Bipolaricaulia bacterium]
MLKRGLALSLVLALVLAIGSGIAVYTQEEEVPAIPGITSKDSHPNGCVDCHRVAGENRDYRMSTAIEKWANKGAPEEVRKVAEASWPGVELTGKHPAVSGFVATQPMPQSCLTCHGEQGSMPLAEALHSFHFTGGGDNHFVSGYDGRCLQCHTLNANTDNPPTGAIGIKSGTEGQQQTESEESGEGE